MHSFWDVSKHWKQQDISSEKKKKYLKRSHSCWPSRSSVSWNCIIHSWRSSGFIRDYKWDKNLSNVCGKEKKLNESKTLGIGGNLCLHRKSEYLEVRVTPWTARPKRSLWGSSLFNAKAASCSKMLDSFNFISKNNYTSRFMDLRVKGRTRSLEPIVNASCMAWPLEKISSYWWFQPTTTGIIWKC